MRARGLKPAFFKNELLATSDPLYAWIFQGLWCLADRAGRLEDRPRRIHLEINPGRSFDGTDEALRWLTDNGFIVRYVIEGAAYIQVVNFEKHQYPHVREPDSKLPAPPESTVPTPDSEAANPNESGASTVEAPDQHCASTSPARLTPDCGLLTAEEDPPTSPPGGKRANDHAEPDWTQVENLELEWWHVWLAHRRAEYRKAPYKTTRVAEALAKHPPDVQRAAIEQSMAKGWQGLFPEKIDGQGKRRGPSANRFAQHQERLRQWLDDVAGGT